MQIRHRHLTRGRRSRTSSTRRIQFEALECRSLLTAVFVTHAADAGVGSLRDAIQQANSDPSIGSIIIKKDVANIEIEAALRYTGSQPLSINGNGTAITASDNLNDVAMLISENGAGLNLSHLTIDGDFEVGETPQNGLLVQVPSGTTGDVEVTLNQVSLMNHGLFGLHIADQVNNTDASIRLTVLNSLVTNNGIGDLDFDGIRVDEGGNGDIFARLVNSHIDGNGGDGLELDERGDGTVHLDVVDSTFNRNGFFNEEDLDDGLDIDEAGFGGIIASIVNSTFNGNFDEGLDLDEEDDGDIAASIVAVEANGNMDEGIKMSEEDGGGLFAMLKNTVAIGSANDDGIQLEEADAGSVDVTVVNVTATDNDGSGLKVEQETVGDDTGTLKLRNSTLDPNGDDGLDLDGVELM